jgi:hypothetical protein
MSQKSPKPHHPARLHAEARAHLTTVVASVPDYPPTLWNLGVINTALETGET